MQVDGERGTPGDHADMAERCGKMREERDPLVLAPGDWTAGGLGEQSRGEVVQVDGLLRYGHDFPDEGMGTDQGEEPLRVISDFPGECVSVGVIEGPEYSERPVTRLRPRQLRHRGVRTGQVSAGEAPRSEPERSDPVGGTARPLGQLEAGLGDDAGLIEVVAEDGTREADHLRRVALIPEGRGRRNRSDPAERPGALGVGERVAGQIALQREAKAPQQHRDVGALRAVVGVELVQHEVLQAARALLPDRPVLVAQQQLVQHLVVREQDVRRGVADDGPVGDEAVAH